uniref:Uncharacterized protein n=1 Tax=Romanomermis culicivorax TaxID=13658 RepID=A0A915JVH8_ROMCU
MVESRSISDRIGFGSKRFVSLDPIQQMTIIRICCEYSSAKFSGLSPNCINKATFVANSLAKKIFREICRQFNNFSVKEQVEVKNEEIFSTNVEREWSNKRKKQFIGQKSLEPVAEVLTRQVGIFKVVFLFRKTYGGIILSVLLQPIIPKHLFNEV